MTTKYRAHSGSFSVLVSAVVSFVTANSILLVSLGLMSLGSVLPAQVRQTPAHATKNSDDAWRAAWQKKWIAGLEAKQKALPQDNSKSGASTPEVTTNASTPLKSQALPAQAVPAATIVPSVPPIVSGKTSGSASVQPIVYAPSSSPVAAQIAKPVAAATQTTDFLTQTKPDVFASDTAKPEPSKSGSGQIGAHTQDNAFAPVGDAWKLLAYLVPMLAVILICLNLLKRFHTRTGRMPGLLQSTARYTGYNRNGSSSPPAKVGLITVLSGAFKKAFASHTRAQPASAIRLIESVPIGGANVHLLEVRGHVLLLGATAGSLNVLAEFDAQAGVGSDDFRDLLHTAAADMDALDYSQPDLPNTAAVTALEGLLREAGQTVSQRSRRLRTVREVEGEDA